MLRHTYCTHLPHRTRDLVLHTEVVPAGACDLRSPLRSSSLFVASTLQLTQNQHMPARQIKKSAECGMVYSLAMRCQARSVSANICRFTDIQCQNTNHIYETAKL